MTHKNYRTELLLNKLRQRGQILLMEIDSEDINLEITQLFFHNNKLNIKAAVNSILNTRSNRIVLLGFRRIEIEDINKLVKFLAFFNILLIDYIHFSDKGYFSYYENNLIK